MSELQVDAGATWTAAVEGSPVSMVEVTSEGTIYAFVLGRGLMRSDEVQLDLAPLGRHWGDRILLHVAVDPTDEERIFVASHQSEIFASINGGANWTKFGE